MSGHLRSTWIVIVLTTVLTGATAQAQYFPPLYRPNRAMRSKTALVEGWYEQYLHRAADQGGLENWVGLLNEGMSPLEVQSKILGSKEYWQHHGSDPVQFMAGLYEDVLDRRAWPSEIRHWLRIYQADDSNRQLLAQEFLRSNR